MGLGIVCSGIVLVLLVAAGIFVKWEQDKRLERLEHRLDTLESLLTEWEAG
jgi:hypothetical protein